MRSRRHPSEGDDLRVDGVGHPPVVGSPTRWIALPARRGDGLDADRRATVKRDTKRERLFIGGGVRRGRKENGGGEVPRAADGVEIEEVVFTGWGG